MEQHRLHPDEPAGIPRHGQDSRKTLRRGQEAQRRGPLPAAHQPRHIQRLVGQMGEGMPGIHNLGRQHRQDLRLVVGGGELPLLRRQLLHGQVADALPAQQGRHVGVQPVLDLDEPGDHAVDLRQLSGGGETRLIVRLFRGHQAEVEQVSHPDHEKFVQVAGKDGDELQPLQQGHRLVPRLLQHPAVEPEPAQLPTLGVGIASLFLLLGQDRHGVALPFSRIFRIPSRTYLSSAASWRASKEAMHSSTVAPPSRSRTIRQVLPHCSTFIPALEPRT